MTQQQQAALSAKEKLKKVKCFLLDMDGTVYVGDRLIGDMKNTLQAIRDSGRRIVFLTNNSSRSAKTYREKLEKLGIYGENDGIYTSGMATARYLSLHKPGEKVYLVGTDALKEEFLSSGIALSEEANVAVLGYDTTLDYPKICKLNELLCRGAYFVATHPDLVCPAPGCSVPDVGSFLEMFRASSGKRPDEICGKPFPAMGEAVTSFLGLRKEEILMAGDRLNTDVQFGINSGFFSLLVYSGEATREAYAASGLTVDLALPSLNDVVPYL